MVAEDKIIAGSREDGVCGRAGQNKVIPAAGGDTVVAAERGVGGFDEVDVLVVSIGADVIDEPVVA